MIKSKDLNGELKILEDKIKAETVSSADVVKALCLLVKVVRDIRTNQTTTMRAQGVKLIEMDATPREPEKK